MSFERQEPTSPREPPQDPLVVIEAIKREIMVTGATDSEPDALKEVIRKLESGKITNQEAIEKARAIQANRQDYH